MRTKSRALLIIAAALMLGVVVGGVVAAQDATATVEPSPVSITPEATTESNPVSVTPEATAIPSASTTQATPRAFLGVQLQDATGGASVAQVVPNSAAATAGLQVNDLITSINGTTIGSAAAAAKVVSSLAPGAQVTINFIRGGNAMTITATLGTQQAMNPGQPGKPLQPGQQGQLGRGGSFAGPRGIGIQYSTQDQTWTVSNLAQNSPLYTDGLRQGDVIKTFDGKAYDPQTLSQYLQSLAQGAKVTLNVERSGAAQDIQINASDLQAFAGRRAGFGGQNNGMFNGMSQFGQISPILRMMASAGTLGINFQTITAQVAQANSLTVTDGALVKNVTAGSAADKAGLKVNDVITAVDGTKVDQKHPLSYLLLPYQPGDTVTLSILRGGASQDVTATLDKQTTPTMGMGGGIFPFLFRLPFNMGRGGGFPFGFGGRGGSPFGNGGRQGSQGQNNGQQPQATPQAGANA